MNIDPKTKNKIYMATGADQIRFVERRRLREHIIKSKYKNQIGDFLYTDLILEKSSPVAFMPRVGFKIFKERVTRIVNVTTKQ